MREAPAGAGIDTWIFDLDNTLYHPRTNLFAQVSARITRFVADHLGVDAGAARAVQRDLFHTHGTTLRGLMTHYGIAPDAFLDFVHDIDYAILDADPRLDAALARLTGVKLIFTNGSSAHAGKVLDRLGIAGHFDGIFDIVAAAYDPKPAAHVYDSLVNRYGVTPDRAIMVEDMARNLAPAASLGMTTVWVRNAADWAQPPAGADYVHHVADELAPWLEQWSAGKDEERV